MLYSAILIPKDKRDILKTWAREHINNIDMQSLALIVNELFPVYPNEYYYDNMLNRKYARERVFKYISLLRHGRPKLKVVKVDTRPENFMTRNLIERTTHQRTSDLMFDGKFLIHCFFYTERLIKV